MRGIGNYMMMMNSASILFSFSFSLDQRMDLLGTIN